MKSTGKIIDLSLDFETRKPKLTILLDSNEIACVEELKGSKLNVELKKWYAKRSLNSNNYAWELITQIADIIRNSKENVYVEMLKRYGQSQMISVLAEVDVSRFLKYYEEAGESTLNGKLFKHYKVYTGSSEMNSNEMAILIDGIVYEAKELGIETMTPQQLQNLKESWKV